MRKTIIILSSCIALLLLGYTSYRGYQTWKQSHGISMAKAYLARGDARNAMLALQQVLLANPRNLEGSRMMAQLLEAQPSKDSLDMATQLRKRVLELDPASNEDSLALAKTALLANDYLLLSNALAGVDEVGKKSAIYHNLAGMADVIARRPAEAEEHFSEAIRLDPSDQVPQMNLAALQLDLTNTLDMAEARISLQRIVAGSTNGNHRVQALRYLIADALRFTNSSTALELSQELLQQTNSAYKDKLLRLDVLGRFKKNDELKSTLALYRSEAATNVAMTSELATWQLFHFPATNTLVWLRQLPVQTRTNAAVQLLAATCLMQSGDWRELQRSAESENWDDPEHPWINHDYLRHAYIARSLREQGLTEAATAEWNVAVKSVNSLRYLEAQKIALKSLFELAAEWHWNHEATDILWTVVNQYPDEWWAFPVLENVLMLEGRTQSLLQLLETMHKLMPNNVVINNDLASCAMLLGDQKSKPYDLALEVYNKAPQNPACASTYAFALYQQGKYADALKVMQQLNPKDLKASSIAIYYGLILKANGNKAEAKASLDRVIKAKLLPEEQQLYDQARAGL
jgi:tetratricopeptide (TPR) repeat protein